MKKNFWAQVWAKEAKIALKTRFLFNFLKFGSLVFLEIAYNDNLQQFLTSNRGKTDEKNILELNLGQNWA